MTTSAYGEVKEQISTARKSSMVITKTVFDAENVEPDGYIDASDLLSLIPDTEEDLQVVKSVRQQISRDLYPDQNTLAAIRLSKGLTQRDLAVMVGSPQPYIAKIESGNVDVGRKIMNKLCDALDINMNQLNEALKTNEN